MFDKSERQPLRVVNERTQAIRVISTSYGGVFLSVCPSNRRRYVFRELVPEREPFYLVHWYRVPCVIPPRPDRLVQRQGV